MEEKRSRGGQNRGYGMKQKEEGGGGTVAEGGVSRQGGEGEIRIRVITALPFPSLFHLCNSPH